MFILVGGLAAHRRSCNPTKSSCRWPSPVCGAWATASRCASTWSARTDPDHRRRGPHPARDRACGPAGRRCCCSCRSSSRCCSPADRSPTPVGNYSGVGEKFKAAVKLADGTKLRADAVRHVRRDQPDHLDPGADDRPRAVPGPQAPAPHRHGWWSTLGKAAPAFGVIGITIVAAFSASNVLADLGLATSSPRCWTACTPRPGSWPSPSASSSSRSPSR